ncbi:uncharacterized protein LOC107265580 isoform X4 [Cephus cinctus]|uniref:Uncharacterized protein LOC107265580 isoform X4 n=1 Tax=Cephus cinctus TaxID=211228 RepID=A0AAJ7RDL4_CEPCN|nr:uncharacterized protein LOC107265580 isoform X4 [Cephus cinctus]
MEPSRVPRNPAPRLIFLLATLALTLAATGMLCGAIMSDHWEEISWDKKALAKENFTPTWYLDGQVAMLELFSGHKGHYFQPAFLVPMHGGIWTLCVSLTEDEIRLLAQIGFPQERCINYLTPDEAHEEIRATWQNTTFALFTLTIIHFKRAQDRGPRIIDGPEDGVVGGHVPKSILKARRFTTSWSLDFGWGGVTLCALASVAWILLSKIMRFSPIAAMIA